MATPLDTGYAEVSSINKSHVFLCLSLVIDKKKQWSDVKRGRCVL